MRELAFMHSIGFGIGGPLMHYVEDPTDPRGWREAGLQEWAAMFEQGDVRRLAGTHLYRFGVRVWISTTFLGLDHQWGPPGSPPLLYETMVFGGPDDQDFQERDTFARQAWGTHQLVVRRQHEIPWWSWVGWFAAKAWAAIVDGWAEQNRAMGCAPKLHLAGVSDAELTVGLRNSQDLRRWAREARRIEWWGQVTRWPRAGMETP